MKKLSLLIVVAFCTGLLLSSCSKLENVSVSKRHYRGGYYVDFGSGKKDDQPTNSAAKTVTPATTTTTAAVAEEKTAVAPTKETVVKVPAAIAPQTAKKKQVAKAEPAKVYAATQTTAEVRAAAKAEKLDKQVAALLEQDTAASTSGSEVPFWLMIVFCIILPPLAVGLKFGIVDKFWISILLTLLFWLPGVIYALIVVTEK